MYKDNKNSFNNSEWSIKYILIYTCFITKLHGFEKVIEPLLTF